MHVRTGVLFGGLGFIVLSNTGCLIGGWTTAWTKPRTEQLQFSAASLSALEARTHNGSIHFMDRPGTEANVTVTKKGGGRSLAAAEEALQAVEVFAEDAADGVKRLGWRWKEPKHRGWSAEVDFKIEAPGRLALTAETHNGSVTVDNAQADVIVTTHNGSVQAKARGDKLWAETHNGRIEATYAGGDIKLLTHNGRIVASLDGCEKVQGSITTHNGGVDVGLGETTAAELEARTQNGAINCDVPLNAARASHGTFSGTIGQGGGKLDVTTHNGSIRIKQVAG
jgi:hypothetical protein